MEKFPNLPNKDLVHYGYRAEPYFTSSMVNSGLADRKNLKKYFQLNKAIESIFVNFELFTTQSSVDAFTEALNKKLRTAGRQYINGIIKGCLESGKRLIELSKNINQKTAKKNLSKLEMAKLLEKYYRTAYNYCVYYTIAWFERAETQLTETLAKKYGKDEKERLKLFEVITSPSRLTTAEREQDDFLKLRLKKTKKPKELEKLAAAHAKKYGCLSVRYFIGEPWTKYNVLQRLKNTSKKEATVLLKSRLNHRKNISKELGLWFKKMSAKDKGQVSQIRDIVYLRTQRADFYHQSSYYVQPLAKKIAHALHLDFRDFLNFSAPEVIAALKGKFNVKIHIAARRKNLITYHNATLYLEGQQATKYIQKRPVLQLKVEATSTFKGSPAFPGLVRGQAKVVISNKDLPKVKKGDILIATMTTPNFISAMELAAAFVTDEGGILCHAAIMSREMKKPCIIGAKVATKMLKTGDMVEVDANKGIVRKLN